MSEVSEESRKEVWKMFDQISPRYDLINHLLSFGVDRHWRKQLIRHLPQGKKLRLLDIATGTGDQLITIIEKAKQIHSAMGIDMSLEMIRKAQAKVFNKSYAHRITLMEGDATALNLYDESVECVTISFGIRNVVSVDQCLKECFRVLTSEGRILILEFSLPENCVIRKLHLFYLRYILPTIAGWISRNIKAYRYLNRTIESFPYGDAFCEKIKHAGFYRVKAYPLTFGVATLYVGEKLPCGTDL